MPQLRKHQRLQLRHPYAERSMIDSVRPAHHGLRALAFVMLCSLSIGCISIDLFGGDATAPLKESVVRGERGPKILLLGIDGVIAGSEIKDLLFESRELSMVAYVREVLDRARKDDEVRAVLLRIDSPGGSVTASDQIHAELLRFKQDRDVPIVAQLLGTATSGGYYIAMAADEVQAHPTTVTGSIGVIYSSVNFVGLMNKLGIEDETVMAGEHKDAGSPFRRLTVEERAQLQSIVDDLHARFQRIVVEGRPDLSSPDVERLANGLVYSATQALEHGLVDRIGSLEDAVIRLETKLGIEESRVVAYHRPREVRRNIYAQASAWAGGDWAGAGGAMSRIGLDQLLGRPGFHYLWWPGLRN